MICADRTLFINKNSKRRFRILAIGHEQLLSFFRWQNPLDHWDAHDRARNVSI